MIIYLAAAALLTFFHYLGWTAPVESYVSDRISPVLRILQAAGSDLRSKYEEQTSKVDLNQRIKDLEGRIAFLTEENARFENLEEENKLLREHLRFFTKNEHDYLLANVISRGGPGSLNSQSELISIDLGSSDGLRPGLAVLSGQGAVVGKVMEVKSDTALVYLTNSPRCKLAATTLNEDYTRGITEGNLGLTIKMGYIPQVSEIKANDIVVTSGLEENIPRGLVIGYVSDINQEDNDLWQSATIEPVYDDNELVVVSVIMP